MSLAIDFMDGNTWTDDQIEAGKETCRSILEEVRKDDIDHQAWKSLCVDLARASLARQAAGDPEDFSDLDINAVAPRHDGGGWPVSLMKRHPRAHILFKELIDLGTLLTALPPTLRIRACGGLMQNDKSVLSDIMVLLDAM